MKVRGLLLLSCPPTVSGPHEVTTVTEHPPCLRTSSLSDDLDLESFLPPSSSLTLLCHRCTQSPLWGSVSPPATRPLISCGLPQFFLRGRRRWTTSAGQLPPDRYRTAL